MALDICRDAFAQNGQVRWTTQEYKTANTPRSGLVLLL